MSESQYRPPITLRSAQSIYRVWLAGEQKADEMLETAKKVIEHEATLRKLTFEQTVDLDLEKQNGK